MFIELAWLIPVLPFTAFVIILFGGLKFPEKGGWVALPFVAASGLLSVGVFWEVWRGIGPQATTEHPFTQHLTWFSIPKLTGGDLLVTVGIHVDHLTAVMLAVVGILVTLIILYSLGYMHAERTARRRYYAEMTLFITGMLGLVVAESYLMLFIFWEIMGLCSYLLIGYWYEKPSAADAAKKAFLTTRVGDLFFLAGLAILLVEFGTLQFDALFDAVAAGGYDRTALVVANAMIFLGAVGKSAQFPLHVWLPDAMEGPTTVSALIHAATMVKAGVYLVARSYPLFVATPEILVEVAIIGGFTALFAATMALVNNDVKRVLAYSTLSQLGYMFLGLGVAGVAYLGVTEGAVDAEVLGVALLGVGVAIFHLYAHAFFKAGLFLSAGSVGHALHHHENPYDMRRMGGLRKYMPVTAFAMLAGTLSIAGFPFFTGFYSKDLLLETVYEAYHVSHSNLYLGLYAMGVLTAGLTAYYMLRLYLMVFEGRFRGDGEDHLHESSPSLTIPLAILGTFAIVGGILAYAMFNGPLTDFVAAETAGTTVGAHPHALSGGHGWVEDILHPFYLWQTWLTLAAMAAGFGVAWTWWRPSAIESNLKGDEDYRGFGRLLYERYRIDDAYNWFVGTVVVGFSHVERWFDENIIDGAVNGVAWANQRLFTWGRKSQTGNVQDYVMTLVGGLVLVILAVIYVPQIDRLSGLTDWLEGLIGLVGGF